MGIDGFLRLPQVQRLKLHLHVVTGIFVCIWPYKGEKSLEVENLTEELLFSLYGSGPTEGIRGVLYFIQSDFS